MTQHYPRRLYLHGEVIDAEGSNSVVVDDAEAEATAHANGYRKAWYWLEKFGGTGAKEQGTANENPGSNGGGTASPQLPENQGGAASASVGSDADVVAQLRAECEALGLKPHHKAGEAKLRELLAAAKATT